VTHVIHFWAGPTPQTRDDAAELVCEGGNGLAPSPRFGAFATALKKKYPDAHMLEAKGKSAEKAVWSDSPITGETSSTFLVLGVKADALDRKLVHFVVKTAGEHGLHTYDMQTGELWRKDDPPPPEKRVRLERLPKPTEPIMSLHRIARVTSWDAGFAPQRPWLTPESRLDLQPKDVQSAICDALLLRLSDAGWRTGSGLEGSLLHRTLGPARQVLHPRVNDPAGMYGGPYDGRVLDLKYEFEIPAVQEKLFALHPKWADKRKRVRKKEQDAYADAHAQPHELFGAESYPNLRFDVIGNTSRVRLRQPDDLAWWPALYAAWHASQVAPLLDACTDLVSLNRFLNNPYRVWNGMQVDEWELMSALALASLAPHAEVPWENVTHTARYRADKMALDEGLIGRTIAALAPAGGK